MTIYDVNRQNVINYLKARLSAFKLKNYEAEFEYDEIFLTTDKEGRDLLDVIYDAFDNLKTFGIEEYQIDDICDMFENCTGLVFCSWLYDGKIYSYIFRWIKTNEVLEKYR